MSTVVVEDEKLESAGALYKYSDGRWTSAVKECQRSRPLKRKFSRLPHRMLTMMLEDEVEIRRERITVMSKLKK